MDRTFFELIKAHAISGYTIEMVPSRYRDEVQALLDKEGLDGNGNRKEV